MTINQMPTHNHLANASAADADSGKPAGRFMGVSSATNYLSATDGTTMNQNMITLTGGNQPFPILQPYLALNFCIALEGIFPSRN